MLDVMNCDYVKTARSKGIPEWKHLTYIGFGTVLRDRFACAMASFDGGVIETVPMLIDGNTLALNAVSAFGELTIRVEGCESGKVFETAIAENGLDIRVRVPEWISAENVVLRFTLKNARLYSYCAMWE